MSMKQVDSVTRDLVRGSSFLRVEGAEEIRQGVDSRLQLMAGEYPWNLSLGTQYLQLVFRKGVPESLIIGEFERRILEQPGMLTVDEIDAFPLEGTDRGIRVPWSGSASIDTLNETLRVQGDTEISAP